MASNAFPSDNLFSSLTEKQNLLSLRMRPRSLDEIVGQRHILAEGLLLPRAIKAGRLSSLILYGPAGTGKTTIAQCLRQHTQGLFESLNAVKANSEDLRKVLKTAQKVFEVNQKKTILFIDEIHRFNKAQQDLLMPELESGAVILIGATVFNPFFSLTSPLLSRSLIFELKPLSAEDIEALLTRALTDSERGLGNLSIHAEPQALRFLAEKADGDARKALNALELGCLTAPRNDRNEACLTLAVAEESIQKKQVVYDRDGDGHYDTISAFIKSMRGSDPDATLYWLAKMLYSGEDPRFIARRICICAAEDVGNADAQALVLASAALNVSEFVGMPEARIPLAQAAVYVACAPKSNAVYVGLEKALEDVKTQRTQEVPLHLKGTGYSGAERLAHGQEYKYPHDYAKHFVEQSYLSEKKIFYVPSEEGAEKAISQRLAQQKKNE